MTRAVMIHLSACLSCLFTVQIFNRWNSLGIVDDVCSTEIMKLSVLVCLCISSVLAAADWCVVG